MRITHFVSTKELAACGVKTAASSMAFEQSQRHHQVQFIFSAPSKVGFFEPINLPIDGSAAAEFSPSPSAFLTSPRRVISQLVDNWDTEIVHFHSVYSINHALVARRLDSCNIPYVFSPHGGYAPQVRGRRWIRKRLFEWVFERNIVEKAGALILVSEVERADFAFVPWTLPRTVVIGNPIPSEILCASMDSETRTQGDRKKLVFVGRLDIYNKGLDLLILAAARLPHHQQEKLDLIFVGPAPNDAMAKLECLARDCGLAAPFRFEGAQTGNTKIASLQSADFVVLTSRWEAFGYGALEPLALGIPVIVTNVVPFSQMVLENNCGFVCDVDHRSIAEALRSAIGQSTAQLRAMGGRGRSAVLKDFHPDQIASRVENLYLDVIHDNRKRSIRRDNRIR